MLTGNLFADIPAHLPAEEFLTVWQTPGVRVERIVSKGHTTSPGDWYDQDTDEWVLLLRGNATLRIEGRNELLRLGPGDHVLLPAHLRHRVEQTDANGETVWLAVHVGIVANSMYPV